MFQHITKYSSRLLTPNIIPEVVRKAFKLAQTEKTGASFIEFPENIAEMGRRGNRCRSSSPTLPEPAGRASNRRGGDLGGAPPIILAGNGVIRARPRKQLDAFAERLNIPVANTFMAKGVIPFASDGARQCRPAGQGLRHCGFDDADVIICIGYDLVEYHPYLWHKTVTAGSSTSTRMPAEVDAYYCGRTSAWSVTSSSR
jgi:acetolactate synthase I/II/III large subunit